MKRLPISVIIPTLRNTSCLRGLLGSLERQSRRHEYEVIVVANLPEPGLKKVVESYGPRFRFLETGRIGTNIARNKGLERARGELVVFFDDDSYLPDKDFLDRIHSLHSIHPQSLAIGGPYLLKDGANACETAYHLILEHRLRSSKRRFDETTLLLGGNWSFKTRAMDERLRFDDTISFGGTDLELFARLRRGGHSFILDDSIAVIHQLRLSPWGLARRAYVQGVAFGRLPKTSDTTSHWHSTLTIEQVADLSGVTSNGRIRFFVALYRRIFDFGFTTARKLGPAIPAFSLARLVSGLLPKFGRPARRRLIDEVVTVVENARDLRADPSRS